MLLCVLLMIRQPPRSTRTTHAFPTLLSADLRHVVPGEHRALGVVEARREQRVERDDEEDAQPQRRRQHQPVAGEASPSHQAPSSAPAWTSCVAGSRSEEHTSELQSLMRISYAVFCLKTKKNNTNILTI